MPTSFDQKPPNTIKTKRFLDLAVRTSDYMPVGAPRENGGGFHGIVRRVRVVRGSMKFHMECIPAFNYARDPHKIETVQGGAKFYSDNLNLALATGVPIQRNDSGAFADFNLKDGESANFELHGLAEGGSDQIGLSDEQSDALFQDTVEYWRKWISQSTYRGRWREMVNWSPSAARATGTIATPGSAIPPLLIRKKPWNTWKATWARARCASGTGPPGSFNSISTVS